MALCWFCYYEHRWNTGENRSEEELDEIPSQETAQEGEKGDFMEGHDSVDVRKQCCQFVFQAVPGTDKPLGRKKAQSNIR